MILSDKEPLPNDSFTYVSDSHQSCSWIDHCMCTLATHNTIKILYNYFLYDHRPMSVWTATAFLNLTHFILTCRSLLYIGNLLLLINYRSIRKKLLFLDSIKLPVDAICCSNVMCKEQSHKGGIQVSYDEILRALKSACITNLLRHRNKRKFEHSFGWNNTMKQQYTTSRNA